MPYRYFTALENRVNWENKYPCYAFVSLNLKSCQINVNEIFFIFPRDSTTKYSIPILFGDILSAPSMFLLQTPHEVVQTGKTYVCPHPGCDAWFALQAEFIAHRQLGQCSSHQPSASTARPPLSPPPDIQIIDSDDDQRNFGDRRHAADRRVQDDRRQGARHQPPVIDVVDVEDHRVGSSPEYLVEPSPDSSPAPPSSSPSPPPPSRRPSQEDTIEVVEVENVAPFKPHGGARSAPPLFGALPLLDARRDSLSDIIEEEPEEDITAVASCSRRETNGVEREKGVVGSGGETGPLRVRPLRNLLDPTFLPLHDVKEKKVFLDSPASPVANSVVFFDSPASPEAASVDPFAVPVNPATVPVQCITIHDSPARLEPRSTVEKERPADTDMSATLETEIPSTTIPDSPAVADVSAHLQQSEVAVAHAAAAAPLLQQPAAILNSEKQAAVEAALEAAPRCLPPVSVMVAAPSGACSLAEYEVRVAPRLS